MGLEQAENRCREAEKDREHWKLEAQLGGLRLEKAKEGDSGMTDKENIDLHQEDQACMSSLKRDEGLQRKRFHRLWMGRHYWLQTKRPTTSTTETVHSEGDHREIAKRLRPDVQQILENFQLKDQAVRVCKGH